VIFDKRRHVNDLRYSPVTSSLIQVLTRAKPQRRRKGQEQLIDLQVKTYKASDFLCVFAPLVSTANEREADFVFVDPD